VRLQNHCPEIGFLVHGPVHPNLPGLKKLKAVKMKGTQDEPVFAFESDLEQLPSNFYEKKFQSR